MASTEKDYFEAKYQTLQDLPGIGPAAAQKLVQAGFRTVQSIAVANTHELVEAGLGETTAQKAIEAARKGYELKFITAFKLAEIHKDRKRMTTGCPPLDRLLNGGIDTHSITEFYGEFGSGKSQICQQLSVTVQLPEEKGGLDGNALYIDTEHVFRPSRITQIAKTFELDSEKTLRKIVYAGAYTSEHQMILLENADEVIKENNVKLIIIDSLTSHFRSEYVGRGMLSDRQQALNQHLHKLLRLCMGFGAAAVVTNQVLAQPVAYAEFEPQPIGGHILGHAAHSRIYLRKTRSQPNMRIAKIVASPFLPVSETPIHITDRGILGDELDAE